MIQKRPRKSVYRSGIPTLVAAIAIATSTSAEARAFDLFCEQRSSDIGFWLGEANPLEREVIHGDTGRVHFFFDTATGDYLERRIGSRAAITDMGSFDIVYDERAHGRDILAINGNTTLHIRVGVERTASCA